MKFIYDFDSTLYATERLASAWFGVLKEHSKDDEEILEAFQKQLVQGFTLKGHASELGIEGKVLDKLVSSFLKYGDKESPGLVFEDVISFLEEKDEDDYHAILTYGDDDYQHRKIQTSGLNEFMDDIHIAGPDYLKIQHLREMVEQSSDPIVFIDNSPKQLEFVHSAGLPIKLIRIARDGERHTEEIHEFDDDIWPKIASFDEISEIL